MTDIKRNGKDLRMKYYWEFLRRNKNFQADLKFLEIELSKVLNKTFEEKFNIKRKENESLKAFVKRIIWKALKESYVKDIYLSSLKQKSLIDLRPPYLPVDYDDKQEFLNFYTKKLLHPICEFWYKWWVCYPFMYITMPEEQRGVGIKNVGVFWPAYRLSLSIDLRKPKINIMNEVERWIDFHKKEILKTIKIEMRRIPWRLFDRYLKIWDLKQKGKNFKEIVKILYPSLKGIKLYSEPNAHMVKKLLRKQDELTKQGYSDDEAEEIAKKELGITTDKEKRRFTSAYNKVRRGYQQAEKLINEGYKEL